MARRVLDRRDHLDRPVLHRHLDAEPAELSARLHLHLAELFAVHVGRMRVERREHAVDGILDQLVVVRLLDVVGADARQHGAEQIEVLVELRIAFRRCVLGESDHGAGTANGQHEEPQKRVTDFPDHL